MNSTRAKGIVAYLPKSLLLLILLLAFPFIVCADLQTDWEDLINQANTAFEQQNYEKAVSDATKALDLAQANFGENHPATVNSYVLLASFYNDLGYSDEAISLYERAYQFGQNIFESDQEDLIYIMNSLALAYGQQGRFDEALPLQEKVYAFKKTNYGEQDPDTLSTLLTLAQLKEANGQYQEAEEDYKEAIGQYQVVLGEDHPDTLFARESLGLVYQKQGRFEDAKAVLEAVYDKRKEVLGPEHPETLFTLGSLAEVYHKLGDYDQAEQFYLSTLDLLMKTVGNDNPDFYHFAAKLAQLYQDQGRYSKAETLFRGVYDYDKASLGEKHPNTIVDLNNLAGIYRLQGRYALAEETYKKSLSLVKEVLGEKHPETISIMNNLALVFENQGLYDQAAPLYQTASKYAEEVLGESHPTTLALMNNLASLYESQGVFDRSEPLYNKTIKLNTEVYGADHPNTMAAVNNLGYLYLIQKEYDQAEPKFKQVYEAWQTQLGERHQKTLKAMNNLARVQHWQGKTNEAETLFSDALRLRKEVLGENHPDAIRSMIDLSALYITQKKYKAAEELLLKTVEIAEKNLGEKHPYTFEAINNLADAYEQSGQKDKALNTMKKCFDRRTEFFERVLWAAGENTRQSYIELHKPEQDRFLSLLYEKRNQEAALQALQASLQRKGLLLKITSEIRRIVELTESPELAEKASALDEKRKQLASMTLAGPTTETPEEFRQTIYRLESELEELQAELGRASQIYYMASKPLQVEDVFQNMEKEHVLVDYIAFNDKDETAKMFAVVARIDSKACTDWLRCGTNSIDFVRLGELSKIKRAVDIFRETIQDEEAEEEDILVTGFDVYQLVWRPLLPYIRDKSSIYIVPDSILHLLPFDAMVNEYDNFLIQSKDLKIMSSSRDLVVSKLPDAEGDFMILAGPDFDEKTVAISEEAKIAAERKSRSGVFRGLRISRGLRSLSFEPLLGAEQEGRTIKRVSDSFTDLPGAEEEEKEISKTAKIGQANSVIYINEQAEEVQLRGLNRSPQMIHIATHGFFLKAEDRLKRRLLSIQRGVEQTLPPPGDNPLLRAGLAFAGINTNAPYLGEIDTDNDGVLTALEVLSLNLTGTRLVVLSACETGVGEIYAGEGVYGLRRAFQEAGVKTVVNSLWPVSDEGTRRLMTSFYRKMYKGMPPRKALKAAKLEMLNSEWFFPYYWASFVLVERRFSADL